MATKTTTDRPNDAEIAFRRPGGGTTTAAVAIVRVDGSPPDRVDLDPAELAATAPPAGALAWLGRVYAAALLKGGWA